jgi:hypothetical protein
VKDYEKQLNRPEWKAFRDRVFDAQRERIGGPALCQQCGQDEHAKPLQVHHTRYVAGRSAWEYDTADVKVLCRECHEHLHGIAWQIEAWVIGMRFEHAEELLSLALALKDSGPEWISYAKNYVRSGGNES